MDGNTIAETIRQITPRHARPIAEDDGIDEQAIVLGRAADMALAAGQKIFDLDPQVVAQSMAMHPSAPLLPTTHESEKK